MLANSVLSRYTDEITELKLEKEGISPLTRETLEKRELLVANEEWGDEMFSYAKQFANADEIVIAAPFWDLGFPSLLKIYIEAITVSGITFRYNNGRPQGLCKARKLTYVTTSGGPIFSDYGYTYIKDLSQGFYGISDVECVRIENLDVECITPEEMLDKCKILTLK